MNARLRDAAAAERVGTGQGGGPPENGGPEAPAGPASTIAAGVAPAAASSSPRWKWGVCVFLLFATALSYLDRQALSVVAPAIAKELSLDNADLGLLLSAFFYAYGIMHLFVGTILDRNDIRFVYPAFVGLWSLSQILCGFARGFAALFGARMLLGGFEAAGQPGAVRIIARLFSAQDRVLANGIMMSGGSIGAMVAGPLVINLAGAFGWRAAFAILGAMGLGWAVAFYLWFQPPPEVRLGAPTSGAPVAEADRWGVMLRNPRFWACAAGAATVVPIIHVASAWIPTYFVQAWKMSLNTDLAIALFLIYLGLDIGFIGSGVLVRGFARRGMSVTRARKIILAACALVMLAIGFVPRAPSVPAAVALVFLLNVGRAAWGATFISFNQDIAPGRVSTVAGLMGAIGSFAGALLIWLIGIISRGSGFAIPFAIIAALGIAGTIPLLLVGEQPTSDEVARSPTRGKQSA